MAVRQRLVSLAFLAGCILAGWRSARNYAEVPVLDNVAEGDLDHPFVSIIIPARNEAARLPELLRSLQLLSQAAHEIIVVDDGSTDGTGEIAEERGARTIRVEELPPGWTGKCHACAAGAAAAGGEWLLFTDADTVHGTHSLSAALELARACDAGLVSLLAQQRCRTFWEKLLLPYAYALYFVGASGINESGGTPVANGQYMLFRREAYARIGGHSAVRGEIAEDVALACLAMNRGVRVVLARGEDHVQVRMYDGLRSLWEGFGKNAARFVAASPRSGLPTVLAAIAFGSALPAATRERSLSLRLALTLTPTLALMPWMRRFGVPILYTALYPLAAAVFQLVAFDSMRRALTPNGTVWKGRRY